MTREEAQALAIEWADKQIEARGATALSGCAKTACTLREFREAAINDTEICGTNPVDEILNLEKWCEENGVQFRMDY